MNAQAIFFLIVFAVIVTVITSPYFWALVGVALIGWAIMAYQNFYWNEIWPNEYFSSEEFLEQKNKIRHGGWISYNYQEYKCLQIIKPFIWNDL